MKFGRMMYHHENKTHTNFKLDRVIFRGVGVKKLLLMVIFSEFLAVFLKLPIFPVHHFVKLVFGEGPTFFTFHTPPPPPEIQNHDISRRNVCVTANRERHVMTKN